MITLISTMMIDYHEQNPDFHYDYSEVPLSICDFSVEPIIILTLRQSLGLEYLASFPHLSPWTRDFMTSCVLTECVMI